MKKFFSLIALVLVAVLVKALVPASAAAPVQKANAAKVVGTPFVLSAGGGCQIAGTETLPRKFTFTGQWSSTTPTKNSFSAAEYSKVVVEFAEPLTCYYNTFSKDVAGGDVARWSTGSGMNEGATEWTVDITQDIYELTIQNVQASGTNGFTISKAYAEKTDGSVENLVFQAPGWNGNMEIISEPMTALTATFSNQWGGLNISNDIIGMEGKKVLRIYSNTDLTNVPMQWCIRTTESGDSWPAIGVDPENPYYAECVIEETLESIYLQYTAPTGTVTTVDFQAITWEQPREMLGTPFVLSAGGGCQIAGTELLPRKFTFTGQWSSTAPTKNNFSSDEYSKIVVEFAEPLDFYYNTPSKDAAGNQRWQTGSSMEAGNTEWTIDVAQLGVVNELSIQNVQAAGTTASFTITKAYAEKVDGSIENLVFQAPAWNGSMEIISEPMTALEATFSQQWGGLNISNDIIGVEGTKILRIYSNTDLTTVPMQWCIKTVDGADSWPAIGVDPENPTYAECVIEETLQSIYLQYTASGTVTTVDFAGITYEVVPPVEVAPAFVYGEDEVAVNDHSLVSVEVAEALKVNVMNCPQAMGISYTINEMNQNEDEEGTFWTVGKEIAVGEASMNAIAYAEFDAPIYFMQGSKYQLTVTVYAQSAADPEEVGTYTYEFNGSYVKPVPTGDVLIKNVATGTYLNGANEWGTKASVTKHGQFFGVAELEDGTYTLDSKISNGGDSHYLGTNGYVDAAAAGYVIEEVEEGVFTIKNGANYLATNGADTRVNFDAAEVTDAAKWYLITVDDVLAATAEATQANPVDVTALLKDANFGRNNTEINAWDIQPGVGGDNANMNAEKWGGNSQEFDSHQTVSNLPNGYYIVKAQGYYRYCNTPDNTNDIAAATHADGTEEINSYLYANGKEVALTSIADEAAVAAYGKMPFSQGEASAAFNMGLYQNELKNVVVTDGTLTVGVKKTSHPGCDWTVWDNFEIYYIGETPAFDIAFDVEDGAELFLSESKSIHMDVLMDGMTDEDLFIEGVMTGTDGYEMPIISFTDFEEGLDINTAWLNPEVTYTVNITKIGFGEVVDMDPDTWMPIFENTVSGELATLTFTMMPDIFVADEEPVVEVEDAEVGVKARVKFNGGVASNVDAEHVGFEYSYLLTENGNKVVSGVGHCNFEDAMNDGIVIDLPCAKEGHSYELEVTDIKVYDYKSIQNWDPETGLVDEPEASKVQIGSVAAVKAAFTVGTSTGIQQIMAEENSTIFNLAGQRVSKAQKGVFIVNGKKVIRK